MLGNTLGTLGTRWEMNLEQARNYENLLGIWCKHFGNTKFQNRLEIKL
jgi:hypothetical protein